jgi:hypothetical protein
MDSGVEGSGNLPGRNYTRLGINVWILKRRMVVDAEAHGRSGSKSRMLDGGLDFQVGNSSSKEHRDGFSLPSRRVVLRCNE